MPSTGSMIPALAKMRALNLPDMAGRCPDRLGDLSGFGSNPGALLARTHVPIRLGAHRPLVVVLHGCTQSAAGYDHGAGWSQLADEQGFAVLYPQQQHINNPNLCFNWFSPIDARRGSGEALSIRQMIAAMVTAHDLDESRIYVTGLSAGGAMASIMLATYPEVFAGGAIIAGLPFGCAAGVSHAFARMRGEGYPSDAQLARLVQQASDHDGPWPTISVWQGGADITVAPSNAERIIGQWRCVHGIAQEEAEHSTVQGSHRRIWRDREGRVAVEAYDIPGMAHGTPLHTQDGYGASGPFMLEAGLSSTLHIARSWRLIPHAPNNVGAPHEDMPALPAAGPMVDAQPPLNHRRIVRVGGVIESVLRKAGLMR